ncbi:response regulator transcription factor [Saccharicrinis fermentans]|uniref:Nitrogen regulation protein C n=1 Tax=Saccharicrinis fermentans DSM 9555 = JCM 21142 TaxID=869213 RepID=W7Y0M0_9BACT|nr:response regulator transcription factor [Saccharicrinis fermentans]GAF01497.1 nitrogen regulation protein C [Saccharicrinis fermentans DSM 9555 = JCM 21142]
MVRILVAEPSYLVRKGLSTILHELKAVTKIEETQNLDELHELLQSSAPHILLINTTISSLVGADALIKKCAPDARVISIFNSPLPDDGNETTLSVFDSKPILLNKLRSQVKAVQHNVTQQDNSEELSEREKDVLQKVALGKTNKEVANELFISTHTVISHRKNITRKLGIKTVSGLTVYAILNKLIQLEDIS